MSINSSANCPTPDDLYSWHRDFVHYADLNGFVTSLGAVIGLPLFPPRVESTAVTGVRELCFHHFSQAVQRREALQGKGRAGFQKPHLPQAFRGEGAQSCRWNIPESHAEKGDISVEISEVSSYKIVFYEALDNNKPSNSFGLSQPGFHV